MLYASSADPQKKIIATGPISPPIANNPVRNPQGAKKPGYTGLLCKEKLPFGRLPKAFQRQSGFSDTVDSVVAGGNTSCSVADISIFRGPTT